jgi:hypothetical protein
MKKLFGFAVVVGLLVACAACYWYVNPRAFGRVFGDYQPPRFEVPTPRSPVSGFQPPQF